MKQALHFFLAQVDAFLYTSSGQRPQVKVGNSTDEGDETGHTV